MRTALLLLSALVLAAPAAAQGANTYRSESGFALDLPDGWLRAPDGAVDEVSRAAGTPPPGLTYEAVFQAGGAPWPSPPFAAVAVGTSPRSLTAAEFRRRWTADDAQARLQGNTNRADTMSSGRVGMQVGVPRWDEATRAAWIRSGVGATGGVAWTVVMRHPSGRAVILLVYYGAPGADEEQVLAELDGVVRSLRVD